MARIGFIGLGNMGLPMARNLAKAGHEVVGFDVVPAACTAADEAGLQVDGEARGVLQGAEAVITMLAAGEHVRSGYLGAARSEEHTSELQSLMSISYDVFCWKKKKNKKTQ